MWGQCGEIEGIVLGEDRESVGREWGQCGESVGSRSHPKTIKSILLTPRLKDFN